MLSSALFFILFYIVNLYQYDELFGFFFKAFHYPQFILVFTMLVLFMWPINTFLYFWYHQDKKEMRDILIEKNMHLKTDIKEEEGEVLIPQTKHVP